ncbi:MAG: hypothetical protein AB7F40_03345 [Victivallaceae bacterium]
MNRYFKTVAFVLIAWCFNAAELHAGLPSKALRESAELATKVSAKTAGTAVGKAAAQYGDDALKALGKASADDLSKVSGLAAKADGAGAAEVLAKSPAPLSRSSAKLGWKQLMAVGLSAGTVVAAYRISDGVATGIETVAEKHPETFADTVTEILAPIKWSILVFLLIMLYPLGVLSWRIGRKLRSKSAGV